MMKEQNNNRNKWLHLRLKPEEYQKIHKRFSKSTCRKLSEYARKNLLDEPLIMNYRNQSLDELISEMIHLRKELNALGNNFNQAVKRLHTLQQIAEFKAWILSYEQEKKILFDKVEEIKIYIRKVSEKWLQS